MGTKGGEPQARNPSAYAKSSHAGLIIAHRKEQIHSCTIQQQAFVFLPSSHMYGGDAWWSFKARDVQGYFAIAWLHVVTWVFVGLLFPYGCAAICCIVIFDVSYSPDVLQMFMNLPSIP